jgi:hypothetical protein
MQTATYDEFAYYVLFYVAVCIGTLAAGNLIHLAMDLEGEKARELEERGGRYEREACTQVCTSDG